uniref:ERCC4 domain-containing protein n=1 Tax=Chromera velia CCMP2878 TaxID=1169474 RepID=A0A0G4H338_9ALVE|eukprot:Cvel_5599.t1-p1 / transcript=Cvel_5599.t1 / gene=Cvel_5599 / organism=Chromera_velia_CCMP2878 / gene_product=hypothetical protein / transcript_product=hypothetical protein / location=Cvel_scaffold263:88473-91995(-) / protein_length=437 / sequence_SO=supercontig / SO=protein_coding / is_pseudo=false
MWVRLSAALENSAFAKDLKTALALENVDCESHDGGGATATFLPSLKFCTLIPKFEYRTHQMTCQQRAQKDSRRKRKVRLLSLGPRAPPAEGPSSSSCSDAGGGTQGQTGEGPVIDAVHVVLVSPEDLEGSLAGGGGGGYVDSPFGFVGPLRDWDFLGGDGDGRRERAQEKKRLGRVIVLLLGVREALGTRKGPLTRDILQQASAELQIGGGADVIHCPAADERRQSEAVKGFIMETLKSIAQCRGRAPESFFKARPQGYRAATLGDEIVDDEEQQRNLWISMLMQVPGVAEESAKAVAAKFPSPISLFVDPLDRGETGEGPHGGEEGQAEGEEGTRGNSEESQTHTGAGETSLTRKERLCSMLSELADTELPSRRAAEKKPRRLGPALAARILAVWNAEETEVFEALRTVQERVTKACAPPKKGAKRGRRELAGDGV